jgi:Sulfotransferase domain
MSVLRRGFLALPPNVRLAALHGLGRYAPWEERFDFTPPVPGPGEEVGAPDFVGIGVQKAGTTWWYTLMLNHPDVSSRRDIHKERHFFDRFGSRTFDTADISNYHGWFPRRPGTRAGEWTPDYFSCSWVPPLLKRAAPDTRLLLLLRDPVDRFFSGLAHQKRAGLRCDGGAIADAFERGMYHRSLTRWQQHFAKDQILVLQFERCVTDIDGQLARTFEFLGLSKYAVVPSEGAARAQQAPARRKYDEDVRARLVDLYAADVAALAAQLPDIDLTLWPSFAFMVGDGTPPDSVPGSISPAR